MARKGGNRSNGLQTVITDKPVELEKANARAVTVARQTDDSESMSTTERLFGDIIEQEEAKKGPLEVIPLSQSPLDGPEEPTPPASEPVAPEPEKIPESTPEPVTPQIELKGDFLDPEKLGDKKIKDGRGKEVSFKEVLSNYESKRQLAEQADRVAEERRRLAEDRRQLQELRQQQRAQPSIPFPDYQGQSVSTGDVPRGTMPIQDPAMYAELQMLKNQMAQFMQGVTPVVYQSNRQRVADELRNQGFADFMEYIPKMEIHMGKVQDPQLVSFYDTPAGARALYFELKAQELQQYQTRNPAPIQARQTAPALAPLPPAARIEGGSQPSTATEDDGGVNYKRAFRRAADAGDNKEYWNEVLRQKGIIPSE